MPLSFTAARMIGSKNTRIHAKDCLILDLPNRSKKGISFLPIKNEEATQESTHRTKSIKAKPMTRDAAKPYNLWPTGKKSESETNERLAIRQRKRQRRWRTWRGDHESEPSNSPNRSSSRSWSPPWRDCGIHLNLSILRWSDLRQEISRYRSFHPPVIDGTGRTIPAPEEECPFDGLLTYG